MSPPLDPAVACSNLTAMTAERVFGPSRRAARLRQLGAATEVAAASGIRRPAGTDRSRSGKRPGQRAGIPLHDPNSRRRRRRGPLGADRKHRRSRTDAQPVILMDTTRGGHVQRHGPLWHHVACWMRSGCLDLGKERARGGPRLGATCTRAARLMRAMVISANRHNLSCPDPLA